MLRRFYLRKTVVEHGKIRNRGTLNGIVCVILFMFSVVYCAQTNLQRNVAVARLMLNKWQWLHIDKVGNGHNLLSVGMKQTYHGIACIQQLIVYAKLMLYTHKHSVTYIQCIKLLIHNIKGKGLRVTDTGYNETCDPCARALVFPFKLTAGRPFKIAKFI